MIAQGVVGAGARVYISSRKAAHEAADEMARTGFCRPLDADLSTAEGCVALARAFLEHETRLDVLINNAGRSWGAPLETFPDNVWGPVMTVNVQAPFTLVRELLNALKKGAAAADPARVINIGSVIGNVVEPLSAFAYAASKAGIHHLSRVLAVELAPHNICVNTVVPGYFPTHMTAHIRADEEQMDAVINRIPLRRMGSPEDIIGACLLLSSRAGAYITGSEIVVDGGLSGAR
jgi:NAD(P)-dependent dehydrogenase (short-subunit alcohol dehydrogenase family)